MAAPRKYPEDLRAQATKMAVEARRDPATAVGAIARIAQEMGIHREALRTWVRQAELAETADGGPTTDAERIAQLEKEIKGLRRENTILKQAAALFAAEVERLSR